jgi:hypothetical protein
MSEELFELTAIIEELIEKIGDLIQALDDT